MTEPPQLSEPTPTDDVTAPATGTETQAEAEARAGLVRRGIDVVRFPPPHDGPIFTRRLDGAAYFFGWLLIPVHLVLWCLIFFAGVGGIWIVVSSLSAFASTVALILLVLIVHHRMGQQQHTLAVETLKQWWLGPWDPVGRLVWLPVRFPEAWRALRGR